MSTQLNRRSFLAIPPVLALTFQMPDVVEIDPVGLDWSHNKPDEPEPYPWPYYQSCDYCFESCSDDIWEEKSWRKIYKSTTDGLIVCQHCLGKHFAESKG